MALAQGQRGVEMAGIEEREGVHAPPLTPP
jgi:hypothetical protein